MRRYPVKFELDDNGTTLVRFPDIPEAITWGRTEDEALARAADALETALSLYTNAGRPIPGPSRLKRCQRYVVICALSEAKLRLHETMQASRIGKAALARRLNCHLPQINRLLDLTRNSRLNQLEAAVGALGKRLVFHLEDAE